MIIKDSLIELLAIALYEHDVAAWPPTTNAQIAWRRLPDEIRENYRLYARGERDYGMGPDDTDEIDL